MEYHPYSNIWPLLNGRDFDELKADIKAKGLRMSILTYQGMVLDGRNRERACEATGVPAHYVEADVKSDGEALDLVVSLNTQRRHLSLEQRAFAAARLANLKHGSNRHQKKLEFARANSTSETTTTKQAAAKVGVSYGSAVRAKTVLQKGAEADEQEVINGKTSLTQKAESLTKRVPRAPRAPKTKLPPTPPRRGDNRVLRLHNVPPLKALTREQVDPEFKGTPMEWVDKYGHVQIMTAEQYATERFDDWASNARALARRWRELPELRDVDHNWLRSPNPYSVRTLTEALAFLRPKIAELEALLACATAAQHQVPHRSARG